MSTKKLHNVNFVLDKLRTYLQIDTDAKLAEYLGVKPGTISAWRSRNSVDYSLIMTKCSDIDFNELFVEDETLQDAGISYGVNSSSLSKPVRTFAHIVKKDEEVVHSSAQHRGVQTSAHSDEFYYLPFYNVKASAGFGNLAEEVEPLPVAFRKYWVKNVLRKPANMLYLIKVEGESMMPTLHCGDMIMISKEEKTADDGIYLVRISDAIKVKRLTLLPRGMVRVTSDNEHYAGYEVPAKELQVLGRVVWFGRAIN